MKKKEIKVGGVYHAKVSGKLTTVRVDAIRESEGFTTGASYWTRRTASKTYYDVTNLRTGRKTTFRSATKFRGVADASNTNPHGDPLPKSAMPSFKPRNAGRPGFDSETGEPLSLSELLDGLTMNG